MAITDTEIGKQILSKTYDAAKLIGKDLRENFSSNPWPTYESFYNAVGADTTAWNVGFTAAEMINNQGVSEDQVMEAAEQAADDMNGIWNLTKLRNNIVAQKDTWIAKARFMASGVLETAKIITTEPKKAIQESALPAPLIETGVAITEAAGRATTIIKYLPYIAVAGISAYFILPRLLGSALSSRMKANPTDSEISSRPPFEWWWKMWDEISGKNPEYTDDQLGSVIGHIWWGFTDKKRKEIRARYGKGYKPVG